MIERSLQAVCRWRHLSGNLRLTSVGAGRVDTDTVETPHSTPRRAQQGGQISHTNWSTLAPNGTNLGLFKIKFSVHFDLASQNVPKSELKSLRFVPN